MLEIEDLSERWEREAHLGSEHIALRPSATATSRRSAIRTQSDPRPEHSRERGEEACTASCVVQAYLRYRTRRELELADGHHTMRIRQTAAPR